MNNAVYSRECGSLKVTQAGNGISLLNPISRKFKKNEFIYFLHVPSGKLTLLVCLPPTDMFMNVSVGADRQTYF